MKPTFQFIAALIFSVVLVSCNSSTHQEKLSQLNGYWEIEKVKEKDGQVRLYKMNPYMEYIQLDSVEKKGFRIKVKPKFAADSVGGEMHGAEHFTITQKNDSVYFYYKTDLDQWKETLLSLKKDKFSVKNNRGITYYYKRFEGLKKALEHHGSR